MKNNLLFMIAAMTGVSCGSVLLFANGHTRVIEIFCGIILILAGFSVSYTTHSRWIAEEDKRCNRMLKGHSCA